MSGRATWIVVLSTACCGACSPALDWREFVPEGSRLSVSFPCRPDRQARPVPLAGAMTEVVMLACAVDEDTFALSFADVADPSNVAATVAQLRSAAVANVRGATPRLAPLQVKGMTSSDQATRLSVSGRLPNGKAIEEHAAFFVRGLRVYEAVVIGPKPSAEAIEPFFSGLRFPA